MDEKIKALKEKLEYFDTKDLLGMIGTHFITFANGASDMATQSDIFNMTDLISPQKQYTYLAGLLMSTDDKSSGHVEGNKGIGIYNELENDIQEITLEYMKNFLDIGASPNPDDITRNTVSMEAFASYFETGILRYDEQTIKLIDVLYSPFDLELESLTGLVTKDYITFYQLVFNEFQNAISSLENVTREINNLLDSVNFNAFEAQKIYDRSIAFKQDSASLNLENALDNLNSIKVSKVYEVFGKEKGKILLDTFGLYRKNRDFSYYNEKNPFAEHPLCWIDEGKKLFIVHPKFLLNAIYELITEVLENPKNKFADKYKRVKAETVERQFLGYLKSIFGEEATYHTNVCEERGTKEHDILVEFRDYILIAEVKASKVREPFFNPQKAYKRIYDNFHSDSGIGGAYSQAIALKKLIERQEDIVLYENKINKFHIENTSKKTILPLVLTLNQFGSLAVNTSLILNKEADEPYPWICNWHDFENIIEVLKYLQKGAQDFLNYLVWRIDNHPNFISCDELDILEEYFLDARVIEKVKSNRITFVPKGSSLIDKIYFEKHGIPFDYPRMKNSGFQKKKKIGRNELCPCGSGKKFKKCCLGKGLYD